MKDTTPNTVGLVTQKVPYLTALPFQGTLEQAHIFTQ